MAVTRRLRLQGGNLLRLADDSGYLLLSRSNRPARLTRLSSRTLGGGDPMNIGIVSRLADVTGG